MAERDCEACAGRANRMYVRDSFIGPVDTTLGLTERGDGLFGCASCTRVWRRSFDAATMYHDYDEYHFELEPPDPTMPDFRDMTEVG
jgi:hypothetical protein